MNISRRHLVIQGTTALTLVGCATSTSGTPLQMAQTYGADIVDAFSGAAATFMASPNISLTNKQLVATIVADLQTAKAALLSVLPSADYRQQASSIIDGVQQIAPLLAPYLGPAALYVPLALSVLQTFIAQLPPPPNTPPSPPAILHDKAAAYRRSAHH